MSKGNFRINQRVKYSNTFSFTPDDTGTLVKFDGQDWFVKWDSDGSTSCTDSKNLTLIQNEKGDK